MEPVVLAILEEPRVVDQCESLSSSSSSSYSLKLVPWLRWDEWLFVYDSLFSDSIDIAAYALRRIATWRSRGCIPVAIEVTASIVEIQLKDPYFRKEQSSDASDKSGVNQIGDASLLEEMLAMLYCMSIIRLVNGVVEKTRKKTEISIAVAAAAIGIPRMLIDVRHEGSHRELPALPVVHSASVKQSDYFISSIFAILMKLISGSHFSFQEALRRNYGGMHNELLCGCNKFLSHVAGKLHSSKSGGSKKQVVKVLKNLVGLYSSFSSEVVSVLLDLLL